MCQIAMRVLVGVTLLSWVAAPTCRSGDEPARFDPAKGALKCSAAWEETTFVLLAEDGETVVRVPKLSVVPYGTLTGHKPPPDYGPRGFFAEVDPGKYVILALAPGKKIVRQTITVTAGKETPLWAELGETASSVQVSENRAKTGPRWGKP